MGDSEEENLSENSVNSAESDDNVSENGDNSSENDSEDEFLDLPKINKKEISSENGDNFPESDDNYSENGDNLSENDSKHEFSDSPATNKRKHNKQPSQQTLKKVKYEDITQDNNKRKKKELYKPPTVEEINELKETENLYNNNLFRLQIDELLKETQIKNKHKTRFNNWFKQFQEVLKNELPEFESILLSDITTKSTNKKKTLNEKQKFIKKLANNSSEIYKTDQDLSLYFNKPDEVEIFGLNKINALPGPLLCVNINLKIPKACLRSKDYFNNRYLVKRYYYLLYIAEYLERKNICKEISIEFHNNNNLLPIIQAIPNNSEKIIVKIYPTPVEGQLVPSRFLCDKSNVSGNVFDEFDENFKHSSTPFYNSTLLYDITLSLNQKFIEQTLNGLSNVQDGIKLILIWLRQRDLLNCLEDFSIYVITYLVVKKKINKHMSSYQVARNFWSFLIETDLIENPISLGDVKLDDLESIKNSFHLTVIDRSGCYNIAAFIHLELYKKIKNECQLAFDLLNESGGINSFHSLFISRLPFELQYDVILSCPIISYSKIKCDENIKRKFIGHSDLLAIDYVTEILKKGLNKRALNIVPKLERNFKWIYGNKLEIIKEKLVFGINLNIENAFNIIELGPAIHDPKEKEFREFWGRLSTDRRFKDGSVCVAVHLEANTIYQKRKIINKLIKFLIKDKLQLIYNLYYNNFEELLLNKKLIAPYDVGTNEEGCLKIIQISDELGKKLRDLKMPLTITGVQGISDVYCFTDVFPSIACKHDNETSRKIIGNNIGFNSNEEIIPRFIQPINCVLQLEYSSKWPKTLEGIQSMKQAFYLEISKLLAKTAKIVSNLRTDCLEVCYKGLIFRYYLYLPKEVNLLKKETQVNGLTVYKNSLKSIEMEKQFNISTKITGALKGINSQYPTYGPSTALIKRWLRSQLIDDYHFPDIVINLLNASLFMNKSPFILPNSPQLAFFRFLKYFSEFQWNLQAVVLNFNEEIPKETINEIDSKLLQNRNAYPELFILMPYDNYESLFTKTAPTKEILQRIKLLSNQMLNIYHEFVIENKYLDVEQLFKPNLDGYNVLIHLKSSLNPRRHEGIGGRGEDIEKITLEPFNNMKLVENKIPVVGFNPIELFLKELRINYGDFALFFHNTYGGNIIGVLWKPKALEKRDFKVSYVNGRKLKANKLILNTDALIEDFSIVGKDLVDYIDNNTKKHEEL